MRRRSNSSLVSETHGNRKLPLSLLITPPPLRLPILTLLSLIPNKLLIALTCGQRKNGQSGTLLLPTTNHGVNKENKTTHGITTSTSYQMRIDAASSLPQSQPGHNPTQLQVKIADPIKVILPSYPPLVLLDMCQE